MKSYDHKKIEVKWQKNWSKKKLYKTSSSAKGKKRYVLDMFPYPSGEGLHVGHVKGYTATDVYSRFSRMHGMNVLHPMGWDAFGLPAEQFAIKNKVHPRISVNKNTKRFKEQLQAIGFSYDWEREINTTDPAFYKWTQWTFLQMYKKGLAYESHEPINWCPTCQTGLANEDLEGNKCERCGTVVEKRPIRQWVLKITDYADRLLADIDKLDWPESIKESQRNWIGRSEGAELDFFLDFGDPAINVRTGPDGKKAHIKVFTTRPDTLFGATYMVLAPEHPWVTLAIDDNHKDVLDNQAEVRTYVGQAKKKEEIERMAEGKEKTGVELRGVVAVNPANGEKIPMFVADYVLGHYGTGAIMAVPAHDERDFAFAKKYNIPIKIVIEPETGEKMPNEQFRSSIVAIVEDPKTKKFLTLNWGPKYGGTLFVGGGKEEGEDEVTTATREIAEETGYTNVQFVAKTERTHHHYFAFSKNVARNTEVIGLHFNLVDETRKNIDHQADEKDKFKIEWLAAHEVLAKMEDENHLVMFHRLIEGKPYTGGGILANSGEFSGLSSDEAKRKITKAVGGKWVTKYKLRDWVFSRQRYWGEPIPLIHCATCGVVPVPEKDLPVKLPEVKHYEPMGTGESPLANIEKWVNVKCPKCRGKAKRETNTMPQWAGSSWYYLRYIDPRNKKALVDKKKEKYWSPVDMYVGGAEHATRHLIYARFWHKFLYDIGVVNYQEPFMRLQNVGLIMAESGGKMSKRAGNVVNPDDVVKVYGADTLRLYEMFMGPFNQAVSWDTKSIVGPRRFIERIWRFQEWVEAKPSTQEVQAALHRAIKKVGEDIETFSFNTAIAELMKLANEVESAKYISKKDFESLLKLLAPFAPHVAEELWNVLGNKTSIHLAAWPTYDAKKIVAKTMKIAVQVDGKLRADFEADAEAGEEEIKAKALAEPSVAKWTEGRSITRVIYVKGRLVNIVTGQ